MIVDLHGVPSWMASATSHAPMWCHNLYGAALAVDWVADRHPSQHIWLACFNHLLSYFCFVGSVYFSMFWRSVWYKLLFVAVHTFALSFYSPVLPCVFPTRHFLVSSSNYNLCIDCVGLLNNYVESTFKHAFTNWSLAGDSTITAYLPSNSNWNVGAFHVGRICKVKGPAGPRCGTPVGLGKRYCGKMFHVIQYFMQFIAQ